MSPLLRDYMLSLLYMLVSQNRLLCHVLIDVQQPQCASSIGLTSAIIIPTFHVLVLSEDAAITLGHIPPFPHVQLHTFIVCFTYSGAAICWTNIAQYTYAYSNICFVEVCPYASSHCNPCISWNVKLSWRTRIWHQSQL